MTLPTPIAPYSSVIRICFLLSLKIVGSWSLVLRPPLPLPSRIISRHDGARPQREWTMMPKLGMTSSTTRISPEASLSVSAVLPENIRQLSDSQGLAYNGDNFYQVDTVVCGGGPAGLLTAIMLAQKYPHQTIHLFDRLSEPPAPDDETVWSDVAKFYLIGLGGRGQSALNEFSVWESVERRCVAVRGRKDWPPDSKEGVERIFTSTDKPVTTQVLPRDKLVGVLHQHIVQNYRDQVKLNYGYEAVPLDFAYDQGKKVLIQIVKCSEDIARLNPSSVKVATEEQEEVVCSVDDGVSYLAASFLIAADGTVRTVANAMERADQARWNALHPMQRAWAPKPFHVKRYIDDNQRVYKTIPMKVPSDWRPDLNYSARTKEGRVNFDALPANSNGEFAGVLLLRKGDPLAEKDTDPVKLRELLDQALPQFSALLDDPVVAEVARKPVSYLPGFRYCGPRLYQGDHCIILGDCAHTVKPYFGLGANSALEDVKILSHILDKYPDDIPSVVREYSRRQSPQAKALVRISRDLDRPGKIGFLTFILPLIMDSIFGGFAVAIFKPNVITMLQREQYTFQQVARRKRLDRFGQVIIVALGLSIMGLAMKSLVQLMARTLSKRTIALTLGLLSTVFDLMMIRALLLKWRTSRLIGSGNVLTQISRRLTSWLRIPKSVWRSNSRDSRNGESFLTPLGFSNQSKKTN